MIAAICQPEHLPWLGWFDKALHADALVLLDNVQYKKRYFENRNKIRTYGGWGWLTVPVLTRGRYTQKIAEVEVDAERGWQEEHWQSLRHSYRRAPHFETIAPFFEELYLKQRWKSLAALNSRIIRWGLERLELAPRIYVASELGVEGRSSELLARICEKIGAERYLSGVSGRDYLDESEFSKRGVSVLYQEFRHPVYTQIHGPFEPCMGFADLLFNHGPLAPGILKSPERRLEQVFT